MTVKAEKYLPRGGGMENIMAKKNVKTETKKTKKNIGGKIGLAAGLATGAAVMAYLKNRKKKEAAIEAIEEILERRLYVLAADKTTEYAVVYNKALDRGNAEDANTGDIEVRLAKRLAELLSKETGATFNAVSTILREDADPCAIPEILIGDTGREESRLFRASLALNEYGFAVKGNKVVVSGTNLTTTERAVELFSEYVKSSLSEDEDGKLLTVTDGIRMTEYADDWFVDVPEFEGGVRFGTHDADLGSLMIYYTDTTPEDFEAYCKKLEKAGWSLWQRNDIEGNLHAGYESREGFVYVYYTPYEKAVRIVTNKAGEYELPVNTEKKRQKKLAEAKIVQLACDYTRHDYGMGYIVALENGNFVIFDGGDNRDTNTYVDVLISRLRELNKRPDGRIVIEGWFISHVHVDHYGTFENFCYKYGKEVEIEQLIWNTPSENYACNSVSPDRKLQDHLTAMQAAMAKPMRVVKVHAGMRFYLGNAEFEILHTTEDIFPKTPYYFNDTSTVWRMNYKGQSSMWLGDVAEKGSEAMCKKYGPYLKSDIVQVSHHGYVGATVELYTHVAAEVALWPINYKFYDRMILPGFPQYVENKYVEHSVLENIIAEEDVTLTVPYSVKKKARKTKK